MGLGAMTGRGPRILGKRPRVILPVAHSVVFRLSSFVRSIDFAMDWEMCDSGRALFTQGPPLPPCRF